MKRFASALICCAALAAGNALALELITEAEAQLPSAYQETKRAGVTRGPGIDVASPSGTVPKDALALKVDFKPRGGATIDPKTVRVTYLKNPAVDLTARVQSALTPTGIALQGAKVPAGEHQLRVDVTDSEGRASSKLVNFVAQ